MTSPPDDFFVGYLPVPARVRRFCLLTGAGILLGLAACAGFVALRHTDPGTGTWSYRDGLPPSEITGLYRASPYPLLLVPAADGVRTILLVAEGKHAGPVAPALDHQFLRARGTFLERDGCALFEVIGDLTALPDSSVHLPPELTSAASPATFIGQVIDPKCYLGAMKPGGGKVHKACASLCIRGGIPPMLAVMRPDGSEDFILLTDAHGAPVSAQILPFVGEQVRASGILSSIGDLKVLALDAVSAPAAARPD